MNIRLTVNGKKVEVANLSPLKPLSQVLRDDLRLTGTKEGCGKGECGACTVLLNGKPVNSCLVAASTADGCEILTIEGLNSDGKLHPVQQAFMEEGAIQCGFCTPGMVLAAYAILKENPSPTIEYVREYLSGNLCRCTGYENIFKAVLRAAKIENSRK